MSATESYLDAMGRLNDWLEKMAAKLKIEAESMRGEIISDAKLPDLKPYRQLDQFPVNTTPIEINIQDEKILIAIENADNLDELAEVKVKYPLMKVPMNDAWNKKLDELLANSTKNFVNGLY
jgi:hypothetical protein